MPLFKATLDDGSVVTLEAEHQPTPEEVDSYLASPQAQKPQQRPPPSQPAAPQTTALGTAGRAALTGAAPTAAFAAAFGEVYPPVQAATLPLGLWSPVIAGAAGVGAGALAAFGVGKAQQKVIHAVSPETEQLIAAGEAQHPLAATVGDIASGIPSFRLATKPADWALRKLALRAGIGGALGAAVPAITEQRMPTGKDILTGAAFTAAFSEPRFGSLSAKVRVPGQRAPAAATPGAAPAAEPPPAQMRVEESRIHVNPEGGYIVSKQTRTGTQTINVQDYMEAKRVADMMDRNVPMPEQPPEKLTPEQEAERAADQAAEHEAIAAAEKLGPSATLSDETLPEDPNVPFVSQRTPEEKAAFKALWDRRVAMLINNKIYINRTNLKKVLAKNPGNRKQIIQSIIEEEYLHSFVSNDEALAYRKNSSALERLLSDSSYLGHIPVSEGGESEVNLAHEQVRRALQVAMNSPLLEVAEKKFYKDHLAERGFAFIENLTRRIRGALGSRRAGEQTALLERLRGEVEKHKAGLAAKAPTEAEVGPGARMRADLFPEPERKKYLAFLQQLRDLSDAIRSKAMYEDDYRIAVMNLTEANPEFTRIAFPEGFEGLPMKGPGIGPAARMRFPSDEDRRLSLAKVEAKFQLLANLFESGQITASQFYKRMGETAADHPDQFKILSAGHTGEPPDIGPGLEPGARYRKDKQTGEFFLPAAQGQQERPSATELGAPSAPPEAPPEVRLTPEYIDFAAEAVEPPWRPILEAEAKSPVALARFVTKDARIGGREIPESNTKRLLAMQDKKTGEVHLVSVYPHGRKGPMVFDPRRWRMGKPNRQLGDVLDRYTPLYSVLVDRPVKNYHERFASLGEFYEGFGDEAIQRAKGEFKDEPATMGEPAAWRYTEPVTDVEAGSLLEAIRKEVGVFDSPNDVKLALPTMRGDALSAAIKLSHAISEQNPAFSAEEVINKLSRQLYDNFTKANAAPKEFQRLTMEQGAPQRGEEAGLRPSETQDQQAAIEREAAARLAFQKGRAARATGRRDLSLLRQPPPREFAPLPKGEVKPPAPREGEGMLTPEELAFVKRGSEAEFPGIPEPLRTQIYESLARREVPKERYNIAGQEVKQAIDTAVEKAKYIWEGTLFEGTGAPDPAKKATPGARLRDAKASAEDAITKLRNHVRAMLSRHNIKGDIAGGFEGADTMSRTMGNNSYSAVIMPSWTKATPNGDPEVLRAVRARLAAYQEMAPGDSKKVMYQRLRDYVAQGEAKANRLIASTDPNDRLVGRYYLKGAPRLRADIDAAERLHSDPRLAETTDAFRKEAKEVRQQEIDSGFNVNERGFYYPGMYEGEIYTDDSVSFQPPEWLGTRYNLPSTFRNAYQAFSVGPFIPIADDAAASIAHRVRVGWRRIFRKEWWNALQDLNDFKRGKVAIEAMRSPGGGYQVPPGQEQRKLVSLMGQGVPFAVLKDYARTLHNMMNPSGLAEFAPSRALLKWNENAKHGVALILDSFHLGRLAMYSTALMGEPSLGRRGYTALQFRPSQLQEAVRRGMISKSEAEWAGRTVTVMENGVGRLMTHADILDRMQAIGLNVGRIHDALYKHFVRSIPVVGPMLDKFNKLIFDHLTRGLMAETAVKDFLRLNKAFPNQDFKSLMRRVIRDTNTFYGNIGKQGWFRNATFRDINQMLFLAPGWVEGLLKKEVQFAARLVQAPATFTKAGGGKAGLQAVNAQMGTLGRGMSLGLVTFFGLTQLLNLITRHHPTWDNPEDGHKLDAFIPTPGEGEEEGIWVSPLSVFAELTHDVIRLNETKDRSWDAIRQIGENKLGFAGRAALVLATGQTPTHQYPTTTGGLLKAAAVAATPSPISIGKFVGAGLSEVAPDVFPKPARGSVTRQAVAAAGIKVEPSTSPNQQIAAKARRFLESSGLRPQAKHMIPTTDPSYSKLRVQLRNRDFGSARRTFDEMRQTRTESQIVKAMQIWAKRPFTGSHKLEWQFQLSLTPQERALYTKAQEERFRDLQNFLEFYFTR